MTTLTDDALALRELKLTAAQLDADTKDAKAAVKVAERDLLERMEAEGSEGTRAGGYNFVPSRTSYGNISDRETFITWALENAPELVEYKERVKLVNEVVREYLDNGTPPPPGMDFHTRESISVRVG